VSGRLGRVPRRGQRDLERRQCDLLREARTLGLQALEVRLPFREGVLGGDQVRVGRRAREQVLHAGHRELEGPDAGVEVLGGAGDVLRGQVDLVDPADVLELRERRRQVVGRDPDREPCEGVSAVGRRLLLSRVDAATLGLDERNHRARGLARVVDGELDAAGRDDLAPGGVGGDLRGPRVGLLRGARQRAAILPRTAVRHRGRLPAPARRAAGEQADQDQGHDSGTADPREVPHAATVGLGGVRRVDVTRS
jgi:hypothetical protein